MFPPQTSLIPVTVALSKFAESLLNQNGWLAIRSLSVGWSPYWYLGVPYRFLTGPVVPLISFYAHKVLPNVSLFSITIYFIVASFLLGALGWGVLVGKIQNPNFKIQKFGIGHLTFVIYLLLPWKYLSSIAISEASDVISGNFLPFALIAFWNYYQRPGRKNALIAILTLVFLLLINTTVFTILLVGLAALILSVSFKKGKFKGTGAFIKPTLFLILASLFIVTLWYTPSYWSTVILNPSIGGAAGYKVFLRIVDLLKTSVPLFFAIGAVYFSGKVKNRLIIFSLTWLFTFLFLTVFRFIGDPDFWQDWSSWFSELETGVVLLAVMPIWTIFLSLKEKKKDFLYSRKIYFVILVILILPFFLTKYIYSVLNEPRLITNSPPLAVKSLSKLSELAGDSRTFISGSTVFWANSSYDLIQVRGGVDKAATHPLWDHAAYQLREGSSVELAEAWLKVLGVEYVLVHGPASTEAYKDFKFIDKWDKVGERLWEENGDVIYKVSDANLVWEVDFEKLKKTKRPENGKDLEALQLYLSPRSKPVRVEIVERMYRLTSDTPMENVLVLVSFSSKWKAQAKDGKSFKVEKDNFGHLLIYAEGEREIILSI